MWSALLVVLATAPASMKFLTVDGESAARMVYGLSVPVSGSREQTARAFLAEHASALGLLGEDELTLISAGSQAEAASALMRIAMDAHKQVRLDPGDMVIFSSRVIPGNERAIANLVNHLYRRGAIYRRIYWRGAHSKRLEPIVESAVRAAAAGRPRG